LEGCKGDLVLIAHLVEAEPKQIDEVVVWLLIIELSKIRRGERRIHREYIAGIDNAGSARFALANHTDPAEGSPEFFSRNPLANKMAQTTRRIAKLTETRMLVEFHQIRVEVETAEDHSGLAPSFKTAP
jgi:hypothetical protein